MRLASTSTVASSGTRPPSTTLSAASQAASKWIGCTDVDSSGRDARDGGRT